MKKTNKQNRYNKLTRIHPWLLNVNSVEEYLTPSYYSHLLKKYSFGGISDLEYFKLFLRQQKARSLLELGCGSGRASDIAISVFPGSSFVLTDLSDRMIKHASKHYHAKNNISCKSQDAIDFLNNTKGKYDLVYTLWSFSHSIHQHVHKLGFENASNYLKSTLIKFVRDNLVVGGKFFIIHFDSMSEEQQILMRQWKRVYPEFTDISHQSPSKQILDSILTEMDNRNEGMMSISHMQGDPIKYSSQEEFLENFMNFHLETFFNQGQHVLEVLADLKKQSIKYRQTDGSYIIKPGCYIYTFEKI